LVQWKPLDGSANFEAKQQIAFGALRELLRVCSIPGWQISTATIWDRSPIYDAHQMRLPEWSTLSISLLAHSLARCLERGSSRCPEGDSDLPLAQYQAGFKPLLYGIVVALLLTFFPKGNRTGYEGT